MSGESGSAPLLHLYSGLEARQRRRSAVPYVHMNECKSVHADIGRGRGGGDRD